MNDELVTSAILEAYHRGQEKAASDVEDWIGRGALTLSAEALRTELGRFQRVYGMSTRLREGVDPTTLDYSQMEARTPEGEDPYEHLFWGVAVDPEQYREVRRAVADALERDQRS